MISLQIRIIVFIALFYSFGSALGQGLLPVMHDTTLYNHQINLVGDVFNHGSRMSNDLSRKFIFGGEIDDELSQKVYENQNEYNRVGGGFQIGVEYRASHQILKSNPNLSWMISVANEAHFSGEYSDDLFGLIFIGNTPFLGDNASFGNTSGRFEQFLSVGGGIHDRKSKSFITLNAILPQRFFQLDLNRGSLAFSETGDQIDLRVEGEAMLANSHAYFKGLGAALNFGFNIPFGSPQTFNGVVSVIGRNIGGYQVYNSEFIEIDTEQTFSGFSVNDLLKESEMASIKDTLNVVESTRSAFKLLPGFLQVGKVVSANTSKKVQSFFGVRMYTNSVYKPLLYVGVHYQPVSQFSFGAQGSFGGYGVFRLGLYANYSSKNLLIGLGTEDLLGAFLGSQYGHSGLIRLAWKI
ncbi:MAG TPA: hypothetical protein VFD77_08155 [Brumimicrobium sp.]|nr:hypothetical protein [Brumimicrobium sp.]